MKFLHTADWHVGKTLKGRNRLDEQRAVLGEIIEIAEREQVDAVLVAGDLYDGAAPSAAAQQLVNRALLKLASSGIEVVVIAGNHDHARTFEALRDLMAAAGIAYTGAVHAAETGGAGLRRRARPLRQHTARMVAAPAALPLQLTSSRCDGRPRSCVAVVHTLCQA